MGLARRPGHNAKSGMRPNNTEFTRGTRAAAAACVLVLLGAYVFAVAGRAQTPPGLQGPPPAGAVAVPQRDWQALSIPGWELRHLERVHRGEGFEAFHIAYTLGSTHETNRVHLTGLLARPYLREGEKFPAILLNHGGLQGVGAPYRAVAYELARRGYVVLASSYRGQQGAEGRSQGRVEFAKGEVIDVLQLTELARGQPYIDTLRMGIVGHGQGASIALQAIGRSNIFKAAVAVSPALFSGMPEYNYAGMRLLHEMSPQLFGRELTEYQLRRELLLRDSFRFLPRIRSPLILIGSDQDPGYEDQLRFVSSLQSRGIEHRYLRFPGMPPDFMFSYDDGTRPPRWRESRDDAWREVFSFLEQHLTAVVAQ
jgi:dipeptidyl aminopeptidase/acylaminoacyl peptidase